MKVAIITTVIFLVGLSFFIGVVLINVYGIRRNVANDVNTLLAITPSATPSSPSSTPTFESTASPTLTPTPVQQADITTKIDYSVPFTAQAPIAQWNEPEFQDGCEEASILMAVYWAEGKSIASPQEATRLIQDMSDWQKEKYGEFRDRSMVDSIELVTGYFNYNNVQLKRNITIVDIKAALADNSVVVVPAAGRELNNPNFTPPGPLNHMLVIRGYDPATNEFITNEPGTRNGQGFRYNENVLYSAIRDYPTGYKEPNTSREKNMLIVKKVSS